MLEAELLPGGTAGYRPHKPPVPAALDGRDPLGADLAGTPQRNLARLAARRRRTGV